MAIEDVVQWKGRKSTKWPRILWQSRKGRKTAKCYGDCRAVVGEEDSGHRDSREVEGRGKLLNSHVDCHEIEGRETAKNSYRLS